MDACCKLWVMIHKSPNLKPKTLDLFASSATSVHLSLSHLHCAQNQMGREPEQDEEEEEAMRHRSLAEEKYNNSDLKSALKHAKKAHALCPTGEGVSSMLTAFTILQAASAGPDWYKVLQVEPFSHINAIKKQYKKLALILHPDKNPYAGCEEAFKLVGEGFQLFSDRIKRKEYDTKLRLRILEERVTGLDEGDPGEVQTFWTACSRCRLLHKFERKYLGHDLVCPNCNKSFRAVEVREGFVGEESKGRDYGPRTRSGRLNVGLTGKTSSGTGNADLIRKEASDQARSRTAGLDDGGAGRLRSAGSIKRMSTVDDVLARSKAKRPVEYGDMDSSKLKKAKIAEETIAQMKLKLKQQVRCEKEKSNLQKNGDQQKGKDMKRYGTAKSGVMDIGKQKALKKGGNPEIEAKKTSNKNNRLELDTMEDETQKKITNIEPDKQEIGKQVKPFKIVYQRMSRKKTDLRAKRQVASKRNKEIMAFEDSDFYDFDKDRVERSFKKGQVWAVYGDNDEMPRHYCLIDEVISMNPFEMNISWLDHLNNGDESLVCSEKIGADVCCGKFRVARKTSSNSVNIFSHIVEPERAAKELYRIYPKKGSVWALYNEETLGKGRRDCTAIDKCSYEIVVVLTTYSDIHGLSMAYLEKVDGFKSIFKRQEIGRHAIKWLEKVDFRLFSHQIPARKLSADDVPDVSLDCWELDPASLPGDLLSIGSKAD